MINVVIPMAGLGSRFSSNGYDLPKPFIDVNGKPMIIRVLENLNVKNANYILIARREHLYENKEIVQNIKDNFNVKFITLDFLTEGTASTILMARELIQNENPLLIANSDQIVDIDVNNFIQDSQTRNLDGSILCFKNKDKDPKWSYAKLNSKGLVIEVKEKKAISDLATVGIYFFEKGSEFINGAIDMIIRKERVNNEYYTCPVYNYLINSKKEIGIFEILPEQMHGIGTPQDLNLFLSSYK